MVIVVLSISSVGLITLFGQLSGSLEINHDIQSAAQMAQECGEHILAARRDAGFNLGGITDCNTLPTLSGNGPPSVAITDPYGGSGCPGGASCKLVTITASYANSNSTITLLLADY